MSFKNGMRPVHPGEVLREDYLKPLDMSVNALRQSLLCHLTRPSADNEVVRLAAEASLVSCTPLFGA